MYRILALASGHQNKMIEKAGQVNISRSPVAGVS